MKTKDIVPPQVQNERLYAWQARVLVCDAKSKTFAYRNFYAIGRTDEEAETYIRLSMLPYERIKGVCFVNKRSLGTFGCPCCKCAK